MHRHFYQLFYVQHRGNDVLQTVNWKPVKRHVVSQEVLAGTEIPGGGGRGTGRDRDPGRRGKRYWRGPRSREAGEEVVAGTEIPGGGGRGSGGDRDPGR